MVLAELPKETTEDLAKETVTRKPCTNLSLSKNGTCTAFIESERESP